MRNLPKAASGQTRAECMPRLCGIPVAYAVTLLYFSLGCLWIFFSDRLLYLVVRDPAGLHALSTTKGLGYVLVTSLSLFLLLNHYTKRLRRHQRQMLADSDRYRTTLQAIGEGVLVTDGAGTITMMNPEAEVLTGHRADSACGQPVEAVFRILDEDSSERLSHVFDAVFQEGKTVGDRLKVLLENRTDGLCPITVCAAPMRDASGKIDGMVLVFRDQTASREADLAVRENDLALRRAQRLAHVGSWCFDLNTGSATASDEAKRIYGITGDRVCIERVQKMVLVTYRESLDRALEGLIKHGKPYDVEFQIRRQQDGALRYIHSIAEYDAKRNLVVGMLHDITDLKSAQVARQESEYRFIELFEHAVDGILVGAPDGTVTDANTSALNLLGVDRDRLIGKPISILFSDAELSKTPLDFASLNQGLTVVRERQYRRPDGSVLSLEMHSKQMPDDTYQTIIRDVTERRRHELEREQLQTQLMQRRKIESIGRLAGGVAHDFNNMLGVMIGYAEIALKKIGDDHEVREDLNEIMSAASRSAAMTSQLLAFARKQPIAPNVIDLNQTVEGIQAMLQRLIGEHIDLIWNPVANPWPIRMDRAQVEQVLVNLCINARDAISGTGRIEIVTDRVILTQVDCAGKPGLEPGCYIKLIVSDNGCGIDTDLLDSVFDPFFTTKEIGKGTGLGLATVYGIVKQNDGFIQVSSAPGEGAVFSIYFPRCDRDVSKEVLEGDAGYPEPVGDADKTVLIVEDEPGILRLSETALDSLGYQVLTATTPQVAIDLAETHDGTVDLLLTDVVMPEMNGKLLAERLARFYPGIHVLYMSGYTNNVIAEGGRIEPNVHFIQKPFTISSLALKVQETLNSDAEKPSVPGKSGASPKGQHDA